MKFKCKQSGQVYEFIHDHDIATMYEHPDYEPVEEEELIEEPTPVRKTRNKAAA